MIEVKSHTFKGNYTDAELDKALVFARGGLADRLRKNPAGVGLQVSGCFLHACTAYHLGRIPDATELMDASCDCAAAMFSAISAEPNVQVTFPFRGGQLSGTSGKPAYGAGPGNWITAMLLAIARRRHDVIEVLRDTPLARLKEAPGERDECFAHWVLALQSFQGGSLFGEELAQADRLSRPEALKVATPAIVERYRAMGQVLGAIDVNSQAAYDQALKASVEAHKNFFGRGKQAGAPDSLIDPISCGLAVLGQERGLELHVRSGYLPEWLIAKPAAQP